MISGFWAIVKLIQGLLDLFQWGRKALEEKKEESHQEAKQELEKAETEDELKKAADKYFTNP